MFGISWAEFLVILIVAILVVPVKYWPDVARALARAVKYVRAFIWKITDAIDDIINTTTNDVLGDFSEPIKKSKKRKVSKSK
jgi:Sec-independent protein translocase protein TatA